MRTTVMLSIAGMLMLPNAGDAQILKKLEKKVERKVNQRIERTTDKAIDKGLDKVEGSVKESAQSKKAEKTNSPISPTMGSTGNYASSKFDFVPGDKILFYDDFEQDAIGDFPVRWNTNGSGEIVTLKSQDGKWLKVPDNTISFPETNGKLPQNFTIEFDLLYPVSGQRPPVTFGFSEVSNPAKNTIQHKNIFYFLIPTSVKQFIGYSTSLYSGRENTMEWAVDKMKGKKIRASIAVNGNRIRLYMDEQKVFDLPKGFDNNAYRNNFHFRASPLIPKPTDAFYISNLRIAETGKDARSTLLKEGKYSTSGIYFATGSAQIKPESHGVIKEIADVLKENGDIKIEIIGHTDNVGTDPSNQKLSEQRAEAVKTYLSKNLKIVEDRISVSGKGASEPVADNSTTEGKSKNRRVVFVKK